MRKSAKKNYIANPKGTTEHEVILCVTLLGIETPIWRRLRMSANMTLDQLHYAIQGSFGWENCHLHAFTIGGKTYSSNQPAPTGLFGETGDQDSKKVTIADLIEQKIKKFTYEYDFGDSWTHEIKIEKAIPCAKQIKATECIDGKRNCPPEDCGGIWGYEEFVKAMKNKKHPEHRDLIDWYGGPFDPDKFSLQNANKLIKSYQKYQGCNS